MPTIIRNSTIVMPDHTMRSDILILDGKIAQIGSTLRYDGAWEIDATGMMVFPGFIDPHVHFEMLQGLVWTADDFDTGTKAALLGGNTTILDFVENQENQLLTDAFSKRKSLAQANAHCNFGFHAVINRWDDKTAEQMQILIEEGVTSFKSFMAYKGLKLSDADLYHALKQTANLGAVMGIHCENGDIADELRLELKQNGKLSANYHPLSRPDILEREAIHRAVSIAGLTDAVIIILHLSSKCGLTEISHAKKIKQLVFAETCPQYLVLTDELYATEEPDSFIAAKYVMSPPLRKADDNAAIWKALFSGDIHTVATDHCSFNYHGQKEVGYHDFSKIPNGIPGVEHRAAILYTHGVKSGKLTVKQFCKLMSVNAAKLYGMYPQKGAIKLGSDADIVIWNPEFENVISWKNQSHNVDYTPYEGFVTKGRAEYVFVNGELAVSEGKVIKERQGKFVKRGIFNRNIYSIK